MGNKYFGTDGIRGTVNQGNITGEKFFKFGLAAGTYFKNQKYPIIHHYIWDYFALYQAYLAYDVKQKEFFLS